MKKLLLLVAAILCVIMMKAQLCPGGGVNFASVVTFDQSWIQGCLTGTSCNGGVEFDNRSSCEPTATMDACAPAPSCTVNTNGSDIWFKFYATSTTANINLIQQVSFVAAIQAFSGGPTCGGLTQIGCAVASGPSTGITLNLTGLTLGATYYYRIFGSASSSAQRNGTYCFCGSTNLGSAPLPVVLTDFKAIAQKNKVMLKWITATETDNRSFELERSTDGVHYNTVVSVAGRGSTTNISNYEYTDIAAVKGKNFYRLKINELNGRYEYSEVRVAQIDYGKLISLFNNPVNDRIIVDASSAVKIVVMNLSGQTLQTVQLKQGRNEISTSNLGAGTYIIKSIADNESFKVSIVK